MCSNDVLEAERVMWNDEPLPKIPIQPVWFDNDGHSHVGTVDLMPLTTEPSAPDFLIRLHQRPSKLLSLAGKPAMNISILYDQPSWSSDCEGSIASRARTPKHTHTHTHT